MEFSSFSSPESSPGSGGPNPSPESGKDSSDSKKKKSTGSTALRAEFATDSPDRKETASVDRASKTESLWKKLTGEASASDEPDLPLFGIQKPHEAASAETKASNQPLLTDSENKKASETPIESGTESGETHHETEADATADAETGAEDDPESERLTDAELKHAAQELIKLDLEAAEGELYERSRSESDATEAAVAAAPVVMLREMGKNLGPDSTMSVSEALDAAHLAVAEDIEAFGHDGHDDLDDAAAAESEPAEEEAEDVPDSATLSTVSPVRPPVPPPAGPPHGPPGGPPGGVGSASSPDVMPVETAWHNERVAGARGLIVGVLAGLYFGNRHGKKVGHKESDKKSAPVIRSFEHQVKGLQDSITAKEQQIKNQAREKLDSLMKNQERQRLAESLLQSATTQAAGTEARRPDVLTASGEPAGAEPYSRRRETYGNHSGAAEVGRILVEAPLAAALLMTERARPASFAERAGVVPFNKKAEEFSREELMTTAEKLTVQGVSLKEMVAVGSLDEQSLRRVIGEFLEGGDVSRAVAREVKEKELKYERDPRMRHAAAAAAQAAGSGGSGSGSGGLVAVQPTNDVDTNELPTPQDSPEYTGPTPTPNAATLKAIRNKQMATVAATTVLIALAVIILIIVTG